jgi:transposase
MWMWVLISRRTGLRWSRCRCCSTCLTATPTATPRRVHPMRRCPTGGVVTAAKFEVQWPTEPARAALVRSHFGARRKAFNWGLAQVKADLDAKAVDPAHQPVGWDLGSLRWAWNRAKDVVAPWWAENSKEAYASGLADLVRALDNWSASKNGKRKGPKVGFPRFTSSRRDAGRVRFSTGTMRVEEDRRTITVPVIGGLRTKENTRRVQRHLASGRARILNMTLSQRWGRLFVSIGYALRTPATARTVTQPLVVAGVDLGMRTLATVATIDTATGVQTLTEYPNPAPLKATLAVRRRAGRELSRRIRGSRGHRAAKAKLSRLDRRCVHLRREAVHQLTTELAGSYGRIVIEDLDLAAMKRSMGRRAYRRAVSDSAMGLVGRCWPTRPPVMAASWWWPTVGSRPARSTTAAPHPTAPRAGWSAKDASTSHWCARTPAMSSTATTTRHAISVTGRITPVVVQSGPRPHRYPGQPHRLVQAMARTPDHPAPAEHPEDLTHVGPGAERPEPKPRKGTPHERVTKTHSTATVQRGLDPRRAGNAPVSAPGTPQPTLWPITVGDRTRVEGNAPWPAGMGRGRGA